MQFEVSGPAHGLEPIVLPDEPGRAEAIRRLAILDTESEPEFDAIAQVAAYVTSCPIALVTVLDRDRLWFKSSHGMGLREIPRAGSFCEMAASSDDILIVNDALDDNRFRKLSIVAGEPYARFYMGKALRFEGHHIGALCVLDTRPRHPTVDEIRCVIDRARAINSVLERRGLHRQLGDRDRLLEQLSREVPGAIFQFQRNPDGRQFFPYSSRAVQRIFEVDSAVLRENAQPAVDRIHPDDLASVTRSMDRSAALVDNWHAQFRVVLPASGLRWLEGHATPERLSTGGLLWNGYIWDITDRKSIEIALQESEARSKLAMSAARLGVGDWFADDDFVHFDALSRELYGLPVTSEVIALDCWFKTLSVTDRAQRADWETRIRTSLLQLSPIDLLLRVEQPGGTERVVEFQSYPVRDEMTGRPRCILVSRDVTEQHESDRLRREKAAAEQADQAKSQFLARVSHELRTPLNAILGFAQLLGQDAAIQQHSRRSEQLFHIESAAHHLIALIDDILDLSRADATVSPPTLGRVEMPVILERALAMIEPAARAAQVVLTSHGARAVVVVKADPRRLEQCVVNLLSNAVKYNRPGGTVTVTLARDGAQALVQVADTGIGLSAEKLAQLFQPFNRLGAEHSAVIGTGLGLSITKALIEQMNGQIFVHSVEGQGSTFTIRLPLASADDAGSEPPASSGQRPVRQPTVEPPLASARRHVLYVEDNGLNRMLMMAIFAMRPNWQLHLASDPAAATEVLAQITPDLLLLDLHLPNCSGLDLLQDIRRDPRLAAVPAIAVSADALPEDIEKALAAGFMDYWVKPIDTRQAIDSIERLFRGVAPSASAPVERDAESQ